MTMLEARCQKCGEVFVPHSADDEDLVHGEIQYTDGRIGEPCGGVGVILGEWIGPDEVPLEYDDPFDPQDYDYAETLRSIFDANS
jgi:hypothetical protein